MSQLDTQVLPKPVSEMTDGELIATQPMRLTACRSQKARGILQLYYALQYGDCFGVITAKHQTVQGPYHLPKAFARPCPQTPQHGFVDSRVVRSYEEMMAVLRETLEADPQGELLLAHHIPATHSAVLTTSSLSIGKGTDGATSGRSITIPIAGRGAAEMLSFAVPPGEDYYFEFVYDVDDIASAYCVQARTGPKAPIQRNYIPAPIKVTQVVDIDPKVSLLDWAKQVEGFTPGTVVYGPFMSLTNHWAVHCVLRKIPFITDGPRPQVGDTLTPTTKSKASFTLAGFHEGFSLAWKLRDVEYERACNFVLGVLHNVPAMSADQSRLIGAAVAFMIRLGALAVAGELRHANRARQSRDKVYHSCWKRFPLYRLLKAPAEFSDDKNIKLNRGGYGGMGWAEASEATVRLLLTTADAKTDSDLPKIIDSLNVCVNQAHNNGWWLNKFVSKGNFDYACKFPGWVLASVAPLVYRVLTRPVTRRISLKIPRGRIRWIEKQLPKPIVITRAQVNVRGADHYHVQYVVKGDSQPYRTLSIPFDPAENRFKLFLATEPSMYEDSQNMYVRLQVGGDKCSLFWPDGALLTKVTH